MIQRMMFFCSASLFTGPAFAHGGHLGELAGHSHWVGAAALAGAALVAGLVALRDRKRKKSEDPEDKEQAEDASGNDQTAGDPA